MDDKGRIQLKDNMRTIIVHHDDGKGEEQSHEGLILIDDGEDFTFKIQSLADNRGDAIRLAIAKVDSAMDSLYQAGMDLKKKLYDDDIVESRESTLSGELSEVQEQEVEDHERGKRERRWQ